jgi:hypothetical protein
MMPMLFLPRAESDELSLANARLLTPGLAGADEPQSQHHASFSIEYRSITMIFIMPNTLSSTSRISDVMCQHPVIFSYRRLFPRCRRLTLYHSREGKASIVQVSLYFNTALGIPHICGHMPDLLKCHCLLTTSHDILHRASTLICKAPRFIH